MSRTALRNGLVGLVSVLAGCASLLPDSKIETKTPWDSYAAGEAMFAQIIVGRTSLTELKALGVDPEQTSNVAILGHADLLRRLMATSSLDVKQVDAELRPCVSAAHACFAYEIEQSHTERKRIGNFWLDFLTFERKVDITGWQFDALVVIKGDIVIYKLWSGKPKIHQLEKERKPLGPLQGVGASIFAP